MGFYGAPPYSRKRDGWPWLQRCIVREHRQGGLTRAAATRTKIDRQARGPGIVGAEAHVYEAIIIAHRNTLMAVSRFTARDGAQLAFEVQGRAKHVAPVVLIHSLAMD